MRYYDDSRFFTEERHNQYNDLEAIGVSKLCGQQLADKMPGVVV